MYNPLPPSLYKLVTVLLSKSCCALLWLGTLHSLLSVRALLRKSATPNTYEGNVCAAEKRECHGCSASLPHTGRYVRWRIWVGKPEKQARCCGHACALSCHVMDNQRMSFKHSSHTHQSCCPIYVPHSHSIDALPSHAIPAMHSCKKKIPHL